MVSVRDDVVKDTREKVQKMRDFAAPHSCLN